MKDELEGALHRLKTRPTPQVVAEAQKLARFATNNFTNKDEVETVAAIMARITLGEGGYTGIACQKPQACSENNLIYGWIQSKRGDRFYIPPEVRAELSDRLDRWKKQSTECSHCSLSYMSRKTRLEETREAIEAEAQESHVEYMSTFGHNCASATGS